MKYLVQKMNILEKNNVSSIENIVSGYTQAIKRILGVSNNSLVLGVRV